MLYLQTIHPDTLELLRKLSLLPELSQMRLVGGTALALQYGHRQSIDLDFFGEMTNTPDEIINKMSEFGDCVVLNNQKSILQLVVSGVKVDVIDYSLYKWIDSPVCENGLKLASVQDIAAMKINAIEGRGSRKDFIDVYMLLKKYSLDEILGFYKQKYPNYSIFRALLSLTFFEDAERESMPIMLIDDSWEQMKKNILSVVEEYQKNNPVR
ncbi:MAG: nucleotidyl transferase AbiEii/AbiGii toxin family protein [Bacteroidales bacterium]|nr:nucleotidyl transferase AbiEii/AbiGii toxin family protein [Bacteroidales bacterium]